MSVQGKQINDPPAPQSEVITSFGTNQTARIGAYTDTDLTKRNVVETAAESDLPPGSGSTTTGSTRAVYAEDQAEEIDNTQAAEDNAAVEPPAHSPNKWAMGTVNGQRVRRDPYANAGMHGQSFFNNQG